ncbi:SCO7613 C-terminal domain-containing membrane protein [Actinoplanes solisilvae]|uniref:SCO7613 C-terminal domain-containing membrane protein n=1 Tax=Actinoplanes solisilvae TaxID=2486853 RepID=UPI000FDABD4B|nr:hypothetical protein [Actinoplanes solisilvae]
MTHPCPDCGGSGCPSCDAAEVARADAEIAALNQQLAQVWQRREAAAARMRARVPAVEVTPRTAQNVLFLLGGLLLGVAAIVFAAVAWAQFGLGGRAVLLASFTVVALAVPFVALRRRLRATAETFAAVGLLLLLLDGYAAWHVDLFGVSGLSGWVYAGAVFAATAAVAVGYGRVTGLTGPRYAALAVAHPVIPLLVAAIEPGPTGWALTFAAVAALDVAVLARRRGGLELAAAVTGGLAALVAAAFALIGLLATEDPGDAAGAGASLLVAAAVVLGGALVSRRRVVVPIAASLIAVCLGIAASRFADLLVGGGLLTVALVALAVAALTLLVPIARYGALAVVALPGIYGFVLAAQAGVRAYDRTLFGEADWKLPVALIALGAALVLVLPAGWRRPGALGSAAVVALSIPAGLGLPWWTTLILDGLLLAGGVWLGRDRSSWIAYGPALAVAFLPPLALVLDEDGHPLRRLLLGAAGVAVVIAGVMVRLRAPVLTGGSVLVVLSLHELAEIWDLIPRWIPLAVAGLVLVLIATTLERRRRDLDRFRAAIQRMG